MNRLRRDLQWDSDAVNWSLSAGEIQVWSARLDCFADRFTGAHFPAIEVKRAARFRAVRDRQRYLSRRGLMRRMLAGYLGIAVDEISLAVNPAGKPFLARPVESGLKFNCSHRDGLALFAFSCDEEIGVDVEKARGNLELLELAGRFFSPSEYVAFLAQPASEQIPAFFRIWTRKEAWIKAIGLGLGQPLSEFSVSPEAGDTVLLACPPLFGRPEDWTLFDLPMPSGFYAALACPGGCRTLYVGEILEN